MQDGLLGLAQTLRDGAAHPVSLISSVSRSSRILRMASAEVRPGPMPRQAAGASVRRVGAGRGGAELASSTSAFTIRPFGPGPIWARSSPLSAAIRRARARRGSPAIAGFRRGRALPVSALGASAFSGLARLCRALISVLVGVLRRVDLGLAAAGGDIADVVGAFPFFRRTAMGVLTFTPSLPSSIRILPILPSSTASNSAVALSVSISAMMSPG